MQIIGPVAVILNSVPKKNMFSFQTFVETFKCLDGERKQGSLEIRTNTRLWLFRKLTAEGFSWQREEWMDISYSWLSHCQWTLHYQYNFAQHSFFLHSPFMLWCGCCYFVCQLWRVLKFWAQQVLTGLKTWNKNSIISIVSPSRASELPFICFCLCHITKSRREDFRMLRWVFLLLAVSVWVTVNGSQFLVAEKKRSCKSTATLPTLTPATPFCPSPLPPPAARQHHFASRASQGFSLPDKFLLFHENLLPVGFNRECLQFFLFSRHVLNLSFSLKLWAAEGNHHNKGSCTHSFVSQGQLWQKFDTRLPIFTKLLLFKTTGYCPRSTPLASTPLCRQQTEQGRNRKLP